MAKIMLLDAQETRSRIRNLIGRSNSVKIGVYSIRKSGLLLVKDELEAFLKDGGSLSVLFGFRTTPDALDELIELEKIKAIRIGLFYEPTFHSKIYVFGLKDGSASSVIGSSNLTDPALVSNIETNVEIRDFKYPERAYDSYFERSEKNRRKIEKRLKEWEKLNRRMNKSEDNLKRKSREAAEGKSATLLYFKLDRQLGKIDNSDIRNKMKTMWFNAEKKIVAKCRNPKTGNGKKAWLRQRLFFILTRVILDPIKGLNRNDKIGLFKAIAEYSPLDSEITGEHFERRSSLRALMSIIERRKLERTFQMARWSKRKYRRRLFRKIVDQLY
jgi:HKD family nuclease